MPLSPPAALAALLATHRLPIALLLGGLKSTSRASPSSLAKLRRDRFSIDTSYKSVIFEELQTHLETAAPQLLKVEMTESLQLATLSAAEVANLQTIRNEAEVRGLLGSCLVGQVNLLLLKAGLFVPHKDAWHVAERKTRTSPIPDWVLGSEVNDGIALLDVAELKSPHAISVLDPVVSAFKEGRLRIDSDGRCVIDKKDKKGKKDKEDKEDKEDKKKKTGDIRRSKLEHVLDQVMAQIQDSGARLAIITNFYSWIAVDTGSDGRTLSFSDPVFHTGVPSASALYRSPLGLLLGVSLAALSREGRF